MSCVVFSDNDIILKLAEYGLLLVACDLLMVSPSDVWVLDTSHHKFRRMMKQAESGKPMKYNQEGIARAIDFAENAHHITNPPCEDIFEALSRTEDIDPGEALLWTAALDSSPEPIILTGDKRALTALADTPGLEMVCCVLGNAVICLEEIIRALIISTGFDTVRSAVMRSPQCDTAVSLTFGSRFQNDERQVMAELDSLILHLDKHTGGNLLRRL